MYRIHARAHLIAGAAIMVSLLGCEKKTPPEKAKPADQAAPAATAPKPTPAPVEKAPTAAPVETAKPEATPQPVAPKPATPAPVTPAPSTKTPAVTPAPVPAPPAPEKKESASSPKELTIQGLAITIPDGWTVEPFEASAMSGTVAAYRLAKVAPDTEDAILKISHFPAMKGKDTDNIGRWLGQVIVDGKPVTKESANFKVEEKGNIRLTTMDAKGAIATSMVGGGTPTPGQRMIAAIIDHPKGPHFVKVTGGEATIAKWRESISAMLSSAMV